MERAKPIIPEYGPLSGMRVVGCGSIVAMPHALTMLGDFGAEVIHVERPQVGDTLRMLAPHAAHNGKKVSTSWAQDARNRLSITVDLDMNKPEVKSMFTKLIQQADIFLENLVWLDKYGISDKWLLEINPKLVIVHVSGYGHVEFGGLPEMADMASYDMIGQAYSGYLYLNGDTDRPPMRSAPWVNDYVSAMYAVFGALTAYINAQKTGKGQVVDIAQYEAMARQLCDTFVSYTEVGMVRERTGTNASVTQPYGLFEAGDGGYIAIAAYGPSVFSRAIKAMGIDAEKFTFQNAAANEEIVFSPHGRELDKLMRDWCKTKTSTEIVEILGKAKCAVAKTNTSKDALDEKHWQLRNNFIEYEDQTIGKKIKAFGVVPHMSGTPGKVWRGAPTLGQDNDSVLKKICGLSDAELNTLKEKKYI